MNRERSETGRKIGEEKTVKEKTWKGRKTGAQGLRREAVCFQTTIVYVCSAEGTTP